MCLLLLITLSLLAQLVVGGPSGIPREACDTLIPGRGVDQKVLPHMFQFNLMRQTENGTLEKVVTYIPGEIYTGRFYANDTKSSNIFCKGFIIVAKYKNKLMNIVDAGFLKPGPGARYNLSNCYPPNAGIMHIDYEKKSTILFRWRAPPASAGNINFRFTCEQHEDFFFANKDGATLKPDPSASVEDSLVTVPPEGFTTVNSSIPKSSCGISLLILLTLVAVMWF